MPKTFNLTKKCCLEITDNIILHNLWKFHHRIARHMLTNEWIDLANFFRGHWLHFIGWNYCFCLFLWNVSLLCCLWLSRWKAQGRKVFPGLWYQNLDELTILFCVLCWFYSVYFIVCCTNYFEQFCLSHLLLRSIPFSPSVCFIFYVLVCSIYLYFSARWYQRYRDVKL